MKPSEHLARFVRDALSAGRSRDEIDTALAQAGWSGSERREALDTWADTAFSPPVPRPRPYVSAREAFFYALMFVALGMTAWHLVDLGFRLVDQWLSARPEDRAFYVARQMRWDIAALIVFFPLFALLSRSEARALASDPAKRRSVLRKWFGYIAMFLSAMALLGDLLAATYALLRGDLTVEFMARLLIVAVVAGVVFAWFRGAMKDAEDA